VVGIHAHVGSGMLDDADVESHREVVERLATVARESPVDLSFVDVGGGFGVPYHPDEEPLDLEAVAATTRDVLADVDAELVVEPGRYLVADAGVLLTEVNTVKSTDDATLAGVDAGMTTLLRPALYGAHHEVQSLAADAAERDEDLVSVVGPICESTDVLAEDRRLPRPERSDLLAVGNAGAYGIEMASQYNSRPRPRWSPSRAATTDSSAYATNSPPSPPQNDDSLRPIPRHRQRLRNRRRDRTRPRPGRSPRRSVTAWASTASYSSRSKTPTHRRAQ